MLRDGTKKLREKYPDYKGILIIVDNLDRVPVNVGEHLFFDYDLQKIDLNYNQEYVEGMANIIAKRVNIEILFESKNELLEIAKSSGGHVRQLMRIMRTACSQGAISGHDKINSDDVEYAIKQEQFSFERTIPYEHYQVLAQVCVSKDLENNETAQQVLYNTSVLEYNGNNRWNYVNPVIKRSEIFKEKLTSLSSLKLT